MEIYNVISTNFQQEQAIDNLNTSRTLRFEREKFFSSLIPCYLSFLRF